MQVGVNYPWFDYGLDFGLAPAGWRGDRVVPRWFDHLDADLKRVSNMGISVVRWFILADGLAYGNGDEAPRLGRPPAEWQFDPPPLHPETLDHFDHLLQR